MQKSSQQQNKITLKPRSMGFHLVTDEILAAVKPDLAPVKVGLLHLFLQHTSASLTINENADPDVRSDLAMVVEKIFSRNFPFRHTAEGDDDMPAHVKSSMLGVALTIPITDGRLNLGTWQGIYLGEHREDGGPRSIIATIIKSAD